VAANGAYKDLTTGGLQRRRLTTTLSSSYEVMLSENLLDPKSTLPLPSALAPRAALLVTTPTVMKLYGHRASETFRRAGFSLDTLVLPCHEWTKTPTQVMRVCRAALRHRLVLKPGAEVDGFTPDDVLEEILGRMEIPR